MEELPIKRGLMKDTVKGQQSGLEKEGKKLNGIEHLLRTFR